MQLFGCHALRLFEGAGQPDFSQDGTVLTVLAKYLTQILARERVLFNSRTHQVNTSFVWQRESPDNEGLGLGQMVTITVTWMVIRRKQLLEHSATQCLILGQLLHPAVISTDSPRNLLSWCLGQEYF